MRVLAYVLCLSAGCLACSKPLNILTSSNFNSHYYSVNALKNDSIWFGKAYAAKSFVIAGKPCTATRFDLSFVTDIPHNRGYYEHQAGISGCMNECMPTQLVGFASIPLAIGKYTLADLEACKWGPSTSVSQCYLLDGGDVVAVEFKGKEGWVQVLRYDSVSKEITGRFEIILVSPKGETIRFNQGIFKVRLTKY